MEQTEPVQPTAWPPRRVALATLLVLGVACAFWIMITFRLVFFSLFIAVVLSTAITPLVERLARIGIPRPITMIMISVLVLLLIIVMIIAVAPLITEQWATITTLISNTYQNLHSNLLNSHSLILRRIAFELPATLPLSLPAQPSAPPAQPVTPNQSDTQAEQQALTLVQQDYNIGLVIIKNLILLLSVVLLTGLWTLEGDAATRLVLLALPIQHREPTQKFLGDVENKVGAYIRGLIIMNVAIGLLAGVSYLIIGLPNVLLLGIFAGAMEIIPLIGPALGVIPAIIVAASLGPQKVIFVLIAYVLIHLSESNLIVPRVMDREVGVSPVVSLLAFIAFGSIFGFLGALLAVPLAAVIQLILHRLVFNANPIEQSPPVGRNAISSLRYEAQNLVVDVRKQVREKDAEVNAREDRIEDAIEAVATDLDSILAKAEKDGGRRNRNGSGKVRRAQ